MANQGRRQIGGWQVLLIGLLFLFGGCAHHFAIAPESPVWVYSSSGSGPSLMEQFAPELVIYGAQKEHNRIGRPVVMRDGTDHDSIAIDVQNPVVYFQKQPFQTEHNTYTNLIYRIHFPKVPFQLIPFNLTYGNNPGILLIITLNSADKPVLITSAGTCGCYKAMVPTTHLPDAALPEGWLKAKGLQQIYGEELPRRIHFDGSRQQRLQIYLRPDVHRVMHMEVGGDVSKTFGMRQKPVEFTLEPTENLTRLPSENGPVSLYYSSGLLSGHVKGALKPLETVFLGWLSFDLFVGMDKAFGDTGNPFYTSLKPWNRHHSDLWHFERFLRFWGWRL